MNMIDLIKSRRSIRQYTNEDVTDEQVRLILEAAMAAPSANALYPWHFVVVRKPETRAELAATHAWSGMCAQAPVVIAVCADAQLSEYWIDDASAATENLLLAATALGLGTVWIGIYPRPERESYVRRLLGIPERLRVLCLVPVGHPAEHKPPRTMYSDDKVHYERF